MSGGLGASGAARKDPGHTIVITPADDTRIAMLGDLEIARSDRTLSLSEAGCSPVVYFPPGDVRTELLIPSNSTTHCPFKGDASYWAAETDGKVIDVGWYYPQTFDEVAAIAGFIAFYKGRVLVRDLERA